MLQEPLELSAPLARELAPQLCRRDPQTGESCAWYHGFWQYARLLGLGTSPVGHARFLAEAFGELAVSLKRMQVLIAGAADYSMLAHVLAVCRSHGIAAQFTAVDWCETPLELNRWYAQRESVALDTLCSDLLDALPAGSHDVLCTHALLGHIRPADRPRLLTNWRQALRPGGRVITVNRLRPGSPDVPAAFSAEQVEAFVDAVRSNAGKLDIDAQELARAAQKYAQRQISWPVRSLDELRQLFEDASFRIEALSSGPMETAVGRAGIDVPTVPGNAQYGRVVAVRS